MFLYRVICDVFRKGHITIYTKNSTKQGQKWNGS